MKGYLKMWKTIFRYRPRNFHLARCIAIYHEMHPLRRALVGEGSGSCLPSAGKAGKGYLKNFQVAF
ncbi:hypothetical protein EIKCOROL_02353 [Eikenella corrodens ATCC 23834]|uniref:Uncharacterized protein n=1 Tax=Eikenella corrodens ATCC 23834 TaxID=546274 RepID=C0DY91_EIKCO|nr:hypothetical protein EIKCOROL_02353 [Eikenella corrodens ATCC 23834]